MTITQITDHSDRALARLPSQFEAATNLQALVSLCASRIQIIESVFWDLLNFRALSTATGLQLDNAGQVLNLDRILAESDASYRARLFAATSQLEKSGEPEHVIEVFNFLMATGNSCQLFDVYPAALQITAFTDVDPLDAVLDSYNRAAMNETKAGGIDLVLQVSPLTSDFYFADYSETDVNGNGPTDALHGFGDEVLTDGGQLSRYF